MKTATAILLLLIPLCAQEASKPADSASGGDPAAQDQQPQKPPAVPATPESAKAAEQAATTAQAPAAAPAPAPPPQKPAGEDWVQGSIQLGYRWIPNITGSFDTYRSVVNLGEGPKLFDADFTLLPKTKRFFDRADFHASSWGDPYNTIRADVQKDGLYRLTVDYRNIAYFNFLPSYADPTIGQGILLDQNSFDTRIRTLDVQLDTHMNKWITPYLGFSQNWQDGRGITDFQSFINAYPVASLYSDRTQTFRAGVRMEMGAYHLTLEQGGTIFREDQGASDNQTNPGAFLGSFLGQTLPLKSLSELYRVRGDSIYTKALLAANPYPWMSVTGQFVYAKPRTDINYTEAATGTFYLQRILQFYSSGQDVLTGDANMPHVTGSLTVEVRPTRRLRLVEYWLTDRFHDASGALLVENLLLRGAPLTDQQLLNDRLALNSNREEVNAYYDLASKLTLRGGYRFEWGDATVRAPILAGVPFESANLRRHVGIAGLNYRIGQKFRLTADAEGSSSDQTFFRTSLQDYQKAHIRGRYDLSPQWRFAADFSLLNNSNPNPNVRLDYSAKIESASVFYVPKSVKWANLLVDYSRSSVRSNVLYLLPQTFSPTPSIYRENGHSISALASVKWLTFGGSAFISSGSRPTTYYQPLARLTVPIQKHVQWISEWRWYSMSELFYVFENFQSNQFMTSVRLSR
ncbi:MAG TPA: hypothetical protein VKX49_32465 [Bryobacteraceae bacterium]|nr:hypothetical protein [Bryobacteraceae bacterium]